MKKVVFAIPGDLTTLTGGYIYDHRIISELVKLNWQVDVIQLGTDFPTPSVATLQHAREKLLSVKKEIPIIIDGLAFGVLPEVIAEVSLQHSVIALVHHPLAFESGLSISDIQKLHQLEREALTHADFIIVTSEMTADLLVTQYGVNQNDISIIMPGNDVHYRPLKNKPQESLSLLAVGSLIYRKGYDLLIKALSELKEISWHLHLVGDPTRDLVVTKDLHAKIKEANLRDRVTITGVVSKDVLHQLYAAADLFVLPSRFEGYGMAYTEAMAYGLPIIGTTVCGIPKKWLAGGIWLPPEDVDALTSTLRFLLLNENEREHLASKARLIALELPSWEQAAVQWSNSLLQVCCS